MHGRLEGRVASGQNDALIKGNAARQRRRLSAATAAPSQAPSVDLVGGVADDSKGEECVEEEVEEEETKRESILSWWEGQFGKVVAISFLGNSPDSCSVDARSPSSVKPNRQRGPASSCPQISVLVSLHGLGEVGVETSDRFCEFFCNFGKENQRGRIDSTWFRVRRGWWGRERNF